MCGIYACFHNGNKLFTEYKHHLLESRGPDDTRIIDNDIYHLAFYRLAIMGIENGMQPFIIDDIILLCNGEIYNYKQLEREYELPNNSGSDCEVLIHLYNLVGIEQMVNLLDGEFAFILIDIKKSLVYFARDYMGIKPLYISGVYDVNDNTRIEILELSSNVKAMNLTRFSAHVIPRYIHTYDMKSHTLCSQEYATLIYRPIHNDNKFVYDAFVNAVEKRIIQSERPIGFLLSGGLDSSLVVSVAMEYYKRMRNKGISLAKPQLFTFGFSSDAPDVKSATLMVKFLQQKYGLDSLEWHLVIRDIKDGLDSLSSVISSLETYDTTTIRASVPMYMLSEYIANNTNVKVILSGEGSDELFGGYLYFRYAPNDVEFRCEILRLMQELYMYDVLRADRSTAAHGLEIRPPFLDKGFVNSVLMHMGLVRGVNNTKELLREIVRYEDLLPYEILWGKKEAFSDAVGLSWKDSIGLYATSIIEHNRIELKNNMLVVHGVENKNENNEKENGSSGNENSGNDSSGNKNDSSGNENSGNENSGNGNGNELSPNHYQISNHIYPLTDEMKLYQLLLSTTIDPVYALLPHLWLPNPAWVKTGVEPSARILSVYNDTDNTNLCNTNDTNLCNTLDNNIKLDRPYVIDIPSD
jgi:asparagine synthase (glutamine-hydrolysing)